MEEANIAEQFHFAIGLFSFIFFPDQNLSLSQGMYTESFLLAFSLKDDPFIYFSIMKNCLTMKVLAPSTMVEFLGDDSEDEEIKNVFLLSDANYVEELEFQKALMASINTSQAKVDIIIIPDSPTEVLPSKSKRKNLKRRKLETGEASQQSDCEICTDRKGKNEMFAVDGCSHSFCSICITKYITVKIEENVEVVQCPGLNCNSVLELDSCRPRISTELSSMWDEMACKSMIPESQKFYCPFSDCSAMLVNDNDGEEDIRQVECPICHRLFCAQCRVPFHVGLDCENFQKLNKNVRGSGDIALRMMAKENGWIRCPNCRFYVEKTKGCLHMTCRCKFQFCYACGKKWTSTHGGKCRPPLPR
ncbi:E3 ubiquitin-protein ligase RSL1-like [Impatiens glandulifera]|uniref:E3 ubiquitin-protein ligase RSL1-like n=1 Tax=Impatiens glandulifera TaxID=253017 RepID=UPI001FB0CA0D|nr:E3 ubiquitin-protein ligase RSL1-like [Impatiens glandulifera]